MPLRVKKALRYFKQVAGLALILLTSLPAQATEPLRIFVAASLAEALMEITQDWPGQVLISSGGSGTIARQVAQGAPADVVFLAHPDWADWLDGQGLLQAGSRAAPIGNELVLVGPADAPPLTSLNLEALQNRLGPNGRLAMGERRAVPAGRYAQDWLKHKGLWEGLQTRLVETESVRSAYWLAARGEVPMALIYRSDLVAAKGAVAEIWTIPAAEQPQIRYVLAAVTERGRALATSLASPEAAQIFTQFGFTVAR